MSKTTRDRRIPGIVLAALLAVLAVAALRLPAAAAAVTSPKAQFGFAVGDDYQLVNYKQLIAYWKKLDAESERMTLAQTLELAASLQSIVQRTGDFREAVAAFVEKREPRYKGE